MTEIYTQPTEAELKALAEKLKPKTPKLDDADLDLLRNLVDERRSKIALSAFKVLGFKLEFDPESVLATLESNFSKTAHKLKHGITWESVRASVRNDIKAIAILGALIERGGKPTVTAEENGRIQFDEACRNVPTEDFHGISMRGLAYDAEGQAKYNLLGICRGNAIDVAKSIHPRVTLTSRERAKKLIAAGLVTDRQAHAWLFTPDQDRGNSNDASGGLAWRASNGIVELVKANFCYATSGARFSVSVRKVIN